MRRTDAGWLILWAIALVGLGWGLTRLFDLRFRVGDVYPPYSSLRADPLGARGLHDSLVESGKQTVSRHFGPLKDLETRDGGTLLWLGEGSAPWVGTSESGLSSVETFVRRGGRLVLTLAGAGEGSGGVFAEHWGFSVGRGEEATRTNGWWVERAESVREDLPARLLWRSRLAFSDLAEGWRAVYGRGDDAVVITRELGRGTVVLCSDSYLFSNEALRHELQADFLLWAVGGAGPVVFDETHLGVREAVGVATLARRYRLQGFLAGLALVAGLWLWQALVPLVAVSCERGPELRMEAMQGRDMARGLGSLLRRYVTPKSLLATCVEEWRRSFPQEAERLGERNGRMTTIAVREENLAPRERDLPGAYRELRDLLESSGRRVKR